MNRPKSAIRGLARSDRRSLFYAFSSALGFQMEFYMSDPFAPWIVRIVPAGLFIIFLAHFGKFVYSELRDVIKPHQSSSHSANR